jgi:hypothetical protein
MTLSDLLLEMYRRTGYKSAPASEITTRFTAFLNTTHRQILTKPGLQRLRDDTLSFPSVANQAIYALPPSVAKIEHIADRANNRHVDEKPLTWLRSVDAGLTSVGGPSDVYVPRGYQPVATQPSSASTLYVKSNSGSDTGLAYLEGFRTGGIPFAASVTMTGITAASFGVTDVIEVTKFYLATAAVGAVTLTDTP